MASKPASEQTLTGIFTHVARRVSDKFTYETTVFRPDNGGPDMTPVVLDKIEQRQGFKDPQLEPFIGQPVEVTAFVYETGLNKAIGGEEVIMMMLKDTSVIRPLPKTPKP